MARYEFSDGKSNKFWEIEISGSEVTTTWGRIGTDGQTKTKDFGSEEKAQNEYDKLVTSKTKKGYEPAGKTKSAAKPAAKPAKKKSAKAATAAPAGPEEEGWQRYELVDGSSSKFWAVKVDGATYTTRYGRIGDSGKETAKEAASPAAAKKEAEKLAASKVKKGYVLKSAGNLGVASRTVSNPSLEKGILKKIDDPKPYLVYGDWLQGQDDPRGELITVQAGLLEDPSDKTLRNAEKKLFEQNAEHFFGPPHPEGNRYRNKEDQPKREKTESWRKRRGFPDETWAFGFFRMEWFCGFSKALWFEPGYYAGAEGPTKTEECVAILSEFLAHPSAKFLRQLRVGDIWISDWEGPDMTHAVDAVASSPVAANLEVLEFIGGDHDISGVSGNYAALSKKCPNLRRLQVYGNGISVGKLDFPKLESFHVYSGGLGGSEIGAIGRAKWPNLVDLEIMFGMEEYGADGDVKSIKPILDGRGLDKLERLGLKNAEFTNDICEAIVGSKILEQLEHLDLSMGTMTEDGARVLIENKALLEHLKTLNLDANHIADELHDELKKLGPDVTLGSQKDPEYVYASVGE